MRSDYEILELEEGASQQEIKRAYFRLLRRYTPEKEPERFQEIRAAYERLTQNDQKKSERKLQYPSDPMAERYRELMSVMTQKGNYKTALKIVEEALRVFGESEGFLHHLAHLQTAVGNTGKAVKTAERLVEKYPDNQLHHQDLAIAYQDRGYVKKAYEAFGKAYAMGCRDNEFILAYSLCCHTRGADEQGFMLLKEMMERNSKITDENFPHVMEGIIGMVTISAASRKEYLNESADYVLTFIYRAGSRIQDCGEEMISLYMTALMAAEDDQLDKLKPVEAELKKQFSEEEYKEIWHNLDLMRKNRKVHQEKRLGELMKLGYEAFADSEEGRDPQIARFMQYDFKLCFLKEWREVKGGRETLEREVEIVRTDYPEFYQQIASFLEQVRQGRNLDYLKNKMLKDYDRWNQLINGGRYYEEYPEERPRRMSERQMPDYQDILDAFVENGQTPFVREGRKIGRNEPCPCGSGKKYKNCCGKNR